MSRGFVKEDDQEEPPFVPPRASLPPDIENYVTPEGFEQLNQERDALLEERKQTRLLSETDRRRENAVIDGKIILLDERIKSAQVVERSGVSTEVRFGVHVRFAPIESGGTERTFKVVGVDEANIRENKVAFTAPIVQAMMGKKKGEPFSFTQGGKTHAFEVREIR
ncbi:MAG: GreA/GreB family elongation factor [Cryomorphaceae bacterium]